MLRFSSIDEIVRSSNLALIPVEMLLKVKSLILGRKKKVWEMIVKQVITLYGMKYWLHLCDCVWELPFKGEDLRVCVVQVHTVNEIPEAQIE